MLFNVPKTIRIIQIGSKFIAIWFAVAGFVHLAENSGDFFCNYCNGQQIDIFNSIYFMIITMTTVNLLFKEITKFNYFSFCFVRLVMVIYLVKLILENHLFYYLFLRD